MVKDRNKDKENMLKSMKFETDEEVELYEVSIYNLIDENDPNCIYDLVEGYDSESELPDMIVILDYLILRSWRFYTDEDYVKVLSKAICKLKGKNNEFSQGNILLMIKDEGLRKEYTKELTHLGDDELRYHKDMVRELVEDEEGEIKELLGNAYEKITAEIKGRK